MCCWSNQRIPYLFSFGLAKCFTQTFIHHLCPIKHNNSKCLIDWKLFAYYNITILTQTIFWQVIN
ncbi:hypothetical protein CX649_02340 [Bacillaceae bacterium ZC4]|nr:hypothetical protein CX649_02340 [Bacillaceae bacterium ZC4]